MTPEEFLKKIDEKISKFESATKKAEETLSNLIKNSNPGKDPEGQEGNPGKDPFVEWFKSNE